MNLNPSYEELWRRVESADDTACDGMVDGGCRHCEMVVETLRGGSIFCPDCNHVNALGHSCADWRAYDAGEIDSGEVGRRQKARDAVRSSGNTNPIEAVVLIEEERV